MHNKSSRENNYSTNTPRIDGKNINLSEAKHAHQSRYMNEEQEKSRVSEAVKRKNNDADLNRTYFGSIASQISKILMDLIHESVHQN